jgi:hypothetical protein
LPPGLGAELRDGNSFEQGFSKRTMESVNRFRMDVHAHGMLKYVTGDGVEMKERTRRFRDLRFAKEECMK